MYGTLSIIPAPGKPGIMKLKPSKSPLSTTNMGIMIPTAYYMY